MATSEFQIGFNHADLQTLDARGLPNPHPVTFSPFAHTYVDGSGRPQGDGYASASWSFDILTHAQLQYFITLLHPDQGDGVNIVTRIDFGVDYAAQFVEFEGFLERPVFGRDYEVSMGRRHYQNVVLKFTQLQEVP
jgi:hypothetical protein